MPKKTFWGTFKNLWLDPKVCADPPWLLVFKDGLKNSHSLKKSANLMVKMAQKCQKLVMDIFLTPKTPRTFEKVLTDPIRPNMSKNVVKKCQKIIFLTPFWGTSKNQRLDLKVCADPSWLLVLKNGLKKHSSLINDWVIDVWSRCKKPDRGGKGRRGSARVWGSD